MNHNYNINDLKKQFYKKYEIIKIIIVIDNNNIE